MSTDTAEAPAAPAELSFQGELHQLQFEQIKDFIHKRNSLVATLNAAQGDRVSMTEQFKNESTDPQVVAAREALEQAQQALEALIAPLVEQAIAAASGSTDEIEAALSDLDGKLKPALTYFKKMYEGDATVDALPSQDRLKGASVGRAGSGGRRIRGYNVVVTLDGKTTEFENFTSAAKHLDLDTTDLQKIFFDKAGKGPDAALKDLPDVVNFAINFTETDDQGVETENEAIIKAYRTETSGNATEAPVEPTDAEIDSAPAVNDAPTEVNLEEI